MDFHTLNVSSFRAFNPAFGRGYKIETAISDGGVIGADCETPRSCAECLYRNQKSCPGNSRGGKCGRRRG